MVWSTCHNQMHVPEYVAIGTSVHADAVSFVFVRVHSLCAQVLVLVWVWV